MSILVRVSS